MQCGEILPDLPTCHPGFSAQDLSRTWGDGQVTEIQQRSGCSGLALVMLSQAERGKLGNIRLEGCGQIFMQTENTENVVRVWQFGKSRIQFSVQMGAKTDSLQCWGQLNLLQVGQVCTSISYLQFTKEVQSGSETMIRARIWIPRRMHCA